MNVYNLLAFLLIFVAAVRCSTECKDEGCSHDCEVVGEFVVCTCPPHMTIGSDKKTCNAEKQDGKTSGCKDKGCSHNCEMVGRLPVCTCPPDMAIGSDAKTCTESTSFLMAMFRGVKMLSEGADDDERLVTPVKASAIDYHYDRKELYAYSNYTIMRFPLSMGKGSSLVKMIIKTTTAATSLAVDWVNDVIYWVSEQRSAVEATTLEGADHRVILSHNDTDTVAEWRNIVVDPYAKKLFWLGRAGIYIYNLQEGEVETKPISWIKPEAITLDMSDQLVYVIGRHGNSGNKYVSRVSYDGSKSGEDIEVPQPAGSKIYGFGVVGKTLYWESNHDGENLYKYDLRQSGRTANISLAAEVNQIVYDMKIYHKHVQKFPK